MRPKARLVKLNLLQDPDGAYVARWVPELARLPRKWMHAPWAAPAETLAAAGVVLGDTYPHRLTSRDLKARACDHVRGD